jgi:hypothetical protein
VWKGREEEGNYWKRKKKGAKNCVEGGKGQGETGRMSHNGRGIGKDERCGREERKRGTMDDKKARSTVWKGGKDKGKQDE